jgi:hypothetical protein
MGMDATVLCIGPFSPDIAHCLQYSTKDYEGTTVGMPVVTELLGCPSTDSSMELARILGVEPFDFNTHWINTDKVKWDEFSEELIWGMDDDAVHLRTLLDHGFICVYRPNY